MQCYGEMARPEAAGTEGAGPKAAGTEGAGSEPSVLCFGSMAERSAAEVCVWV